MVWASLQQKPSPLKQSFHRYITSLLHKDVCKLWQNSRSFLYKLEQYSIFLLLQVQQKASKFHAKRNDLLREIQALTQKEDFLTAKTSCQSGPALVTPSYAYPTQNSAWTDNSETIQQENNNREMTSLGDISQADDRVKKFYGIPTNATANGNAVKSSGSSNNNNNADKRSVRMVKRDSKERVATGPTSSGGSSIRNSSSSCEDLNSGGSDGSSSGAAGRHPQTGALMKNYNLCSYFVLVSNFRCLKNLRKFRFQ